MCVWFNVALRPQKPEGSLGRGAQDGHLDFHMAHELCRSLRLSLGVYRDAKGKNSHWPYRWEFENLKGAKRRQKTTNVSFICENTEGTGETLPGSGGRTILPSLGEHTGYG